MNSSVKKLLQKHQQLIQSDFKKVSSHVQRQEDDWYVNTIMLEGYNCPFIYKRQIKYNSLTGSTVNITYYADKQTVAGFEMDVMRVVRIKVS